ncbi:glycosyltransferase [Clostridium perfringens]|uniref:glycosyltransferase n=2 Tax=Clostridium perfringens TaxID=1502 RepID=UPI001A2AB37A|nr:glycosyltransferase [Clostridium perfringens]EJT6167523.1 glycosyltransferase [Clostridium perfringens]EJT6620371.1 glycosyltransferase [Clostridium perfringens]ELC8422934.1 glycosyltransferase [Clostridium perfringens]MBO3404637.1 glycosyltransferase [Clostridium perfringens]MDM0614699.1 glycosyltransferase [Clostridium perfringens]
MKILHWDEMFHPAFGYQINVLAKFQALQGHEVTIVTSSKIEKHPTFSGFANSVNIKELDTEYRQKYGIKIIRLPIWRVISGRVIYKRGYIKKIKELNPDVIMCHTNDTLSSIRIAQKYKSINIPIVFDNHMLEMAAKNPLSKIFRLYFKNFVTPIIKKNNWIVIRTQDDKYVNKCLGIPEKQTPFISFGTDTSIFYRDVKIRREFRKELNLDEKDFVIVYTGKINQDKGGKLLAKAFMNKFNTDRNIVLLCIGNIENSDYGREVEKIFNKSKNRIIRFKTQNYLELAKFYQVADLSVFPKQCSLSFYDAQACGLPVLSEDNNINIDRNKHNNGICFKSGNIEDFISKIEMLSEINEKEYEKMRQNSINFIVNNYDYKNIAEKYTKILIEEYNRFRKEQ